jgi:hypothetical protein
MKGRSSFLTRTPNKTVTRRRCQTAQVVRQGKSTGIVKRKEGCVVRMISLCEESSSPDEEEWVYFVCLQKLQNYKASRGLMFVAPDGNLTGGALILFQGGTR